MRTIDLQIPQIGTSKLAESFLIALMIILLGLPARAQFFESLVCPQVTINLSHPPDLGIKVTKIAFGPATGKCSDQLIDAIQSDFINNNIEVIDRVHLNSILAEHQLTFSGYVDQSSAAAMGKILGSSALVFIKVYTCNVKVEKSVGKKEVINKDKSKSQIPNYFVRTLAQLKGSVQAVDLATGRIFASQPFEYTPESRLESTEGYPQPPAESEMQNQAFLMVVQDVHRMFLPWSESTTLSYYDNKEHDLKSAYQAMKSGNLDLAFDLSVKNLEGCKSDTQIKDKLLSHAYYNMGMSYLLREEHDKAMGYFEAAAKLHPGDIVNSAMSKCRKGKELLISRQQIEQKATFEAEKKMEEEHRTVQAEQANTLLNKDIIKLSQLKLSKVIILQKIKNSKCNFDTSTDALVELTNAGIDDEIIVEMMNKK